MDPITALSLQTLLSYLVGLAANLRSEDILARRKQLEEALKQRKTALDGIRSAPSLRVHLQGVATEVVRLTAAGQTTPIERPIFALLADETFQSDLVDWLVQWNEPGGKAAEERLRERMSGALSKGGATDEQIRQFESEYFELVDRVVFANPTLALWRQHLCLTYLHDQVAELKRLAERAAGHYTEAEREAALQRYCRRALDTWDIIDLSNLPEGDRQIATTKILLRQLYVPLRLHVEIERGTEPAGKALQGIEARREQRRLQEAGRIAGGPEAKDLPGQERARVPAGERLGQAGRLVVLGDPGGGKTTLMRWMATAYLLAFTHATERAEMPDVDTLPDRPWIPILIRCRDLDDTSLCGALDDFLAQTLKNMELTADESAIIRTVVTERMASGQALLLVDGLDEISSPRTRARFCRQLERVAVVYDTASIVVTSRIVGYREMPYRMGAGFEHGTIADLSREDKDEFAARWCAVTELPDRQQQRTEELIRSLHSSDRIERLTGNPMLLTTLALVKRKVGKLPSRRVELYSEAVQVLLNWNPEVYEQIDQREAIPQLEYVAFEMCWRGVQKLGEEDILGLLDRIRVEYPNIRPIRNRTSKEFLDLLEARSGLLCRVGGLEGEGAEGPIYEFRHLTFQEYLAARALVDGCYPDRDRSLTLAEQVAPLAARVEESSRGVRPEPEYEVVESWREALRLCVAACKDDDVDDVLRAILTRQPGEEAGRTGRARAVLAAACLADELNVSREVALEVLTAFAAHVDRRDGGGRVESPVDAVAIEMAHSEWASDLQRLLAEEFRRRDAAVRERFGGLCGMVGADVAPEDAGAFEGWLQDQVAQLCSEERTEALVSAFAILVLAYERRMQVVPGMVEALLAMLKGDGASIHAAAFALYWLSGGHRDERGVWTPGDAEVDALIGALQAPNCDGECRSLLAYSLGAARAPRARGALRTLLRDDYPDVRRVAVESLSGSRDEMDRWLLSEGFEVPFPALDPHKPIDELRVVQAAVHLKLSPDEVRRRYENLAQDFGLTLTWVPSQAGTAGECEPVPDDSSSM